MGALGKTLIIIGLLLVVIGVVMHFPQLRIGRLPGDIIVKRENFTFYFPLATCFLISLVLTILGWFFFHLK